MIEEHSKGVVFVTCDVCSLDRELYPLGKFKTTKKSMREGKKPCGCSKSPRYNKTQMEIVASRRVSARGWKFLGFKGEYKGVKTLMIMENLDGDVCDTVTVNNLPKIVDFPTTRYERTSKSNRTPYLTVVENLQSIAQKREGLILDFKESQYKNNSSVVNYLCKRGHHCKAKVAVLLRGSWCNECSYLEHDWGYYEDRCNENDHLYLIVLKNENEKFLKTGRAFDPEVRFNAFRLEGFQVEVVTIWKGIHHSVYTIEQSIQKDLPPKYKWWPSRFNGWSECTTLSAKNYLLDTINNKFTKAGK
ncbi:hypothetical protein NVP1187O_121 [Vibrio phage 1.187.O._10N.286.49.F1]|nr:hypothetical protein NVP1187O_121 [Vibrio phage 1.187.O._10N.286.49.F1]